MPSSRTSILAKMFEKPSTRHQRCTNFSSVHTRQTSSTGALNVCVTARSSVFCGSFAMLLLLSALSGFLHSRPHDLLDERRRQRIVGTEVNRCARKLMGGRDLIPHGGRKLRAHREERQMLLLRHEADQISLYREDDRRSVRDSLLNLRHRALDQHPQVLFPPLVPSLS